MKAKDFIGGALLGVIIGAAVGLLLAPQSGEETREAIREYSDEMGDKAKETSRHWMESGRDLYEQGKSKVADAVQTGREKVDAVMASTSRKTDNNA